MSATPNSSEDEDKVEKIKKAVVAFGKKKGQITVDELRELLPPDVVDPKNIGDWRDMLEEKGVTVLDEDPNANKAKSKTRKRDREGEGETTRTNDPVRM
ncbi:MAG: hypothetical protein KC431_24385, partial [Myxococcales bacterium]|nr:hypothetical protein [Myxococcales bacterium]